jgi:hypothetical protein
MQAKPTNNIPIMFSHIIKFLTFVGEGNPSLEWICGYTPFCVGTGIGSEIGRKLGLGGLAIAKHGLCTLVLNENASLVKR